ncbi:unnamed protein product [Musa acuminata subsp. malaccensis]|uniref:(wild Malaysian banana) hypothetical protein n=1 Tax=Musa acuminata subsp. malaccensis TaxID=214687 RepID=A0A804I975_MUSAM|nr:unnamed protein product [Musa acuminata subsp. malaccensis]
MADMLKNTCSVDLVGLKKLENRSCPLSDDVLVEIISHLPAKAFFKLLPVCKTFRQLTLDSHFLLSQSYYNNTISGFIVHSDNILNSIILIDPYAGVPSSSLKFITDTESIFLGSAGGLVFVLNQKYERFDATTTGICVYNPARGTRCWLPSPPGECTPGGIAVRFMNDEDGVMKDYKLVYVTQTSGLSISHHCRVYDSVARAWTVDKELDLGHQQLDLEDPVVCGDAVFWLSSDLKSYSRIGPYVVTFDVREECTQIIPLPSETVIDFFALFGIAKWEGKSLCLIHYSSFSGVIGLWPLKKTSDGTLEWVKMHEISLAQMGFTGEPCFVNHVKLIEVATTTLLVFITYDSMYSYNVKDGGALKCQDCWGFPYSHNFIPYSNTLRPCGDREERLEAI